MELVAICIAALLSQCSFTGVVTQTFNSFNTPNSQVISAIAPAILLYSASAELLLTVCCFLDFQEIRDKRVSQLDNIPVTDLRVLGHAA